MESMPKLWGDVSWQDEMDVKLVAEPTPGHPVEQEIATLEREDLLSPASVGLSIAEGKQILENLQKQWWRRA